MREKDIQNIKRRLIECLAFLEVKTYKGIRNHCGAIVDIIDEAEYEDPNRNDSNWGEEDDDC